MFPGTAPGGFFSPRLRETIEAIEAMKRLKQSTESEHCPIAGRTNESM
jgi:hypothetical protein